MKRFLASKDSIEIETPLAALAGQYLFTLALIALTAILLLPFQKTISSSVAALVFFIPVGLSAALWGLGPGIISSLLCFLALNYLFIPPYRSFQVHRTQDLLVLAIFFVVAVVINQLVGRTRFSLEQATARQHQTTLLFELSTALAGLNDRQAIGRALAEKTLLTFNAACAQVTIEHGHGEEPVVIRLPERAQFSAEEKPAMLIPIETARGLLGEICLWRAKPPINATEERLLQTFASQGALALERASLAKAEKRAQVLEESDQLKSALLSSVSHELRTPLATIKASVTSLLSDEMSLDPESRLELLQAIEEETDHLNLLVGNLLDMSRIESGGLQLQRRWNVLAEIVSRAVAQLRPMAGTCQIINKISDSLPLVPVDYALMERVFTNLISNSIKYSPEGSDIIISAQVKDAQTLLVQVSNRGPHVPEESLGRIFDKFYRVTSAERITGTGLGLSICKGFIEAHSGRIWAENLPEGFAFKFTLPLTERGTLPHLPVEQ